MVKKRAEDDYVNMRVHRDVYYPFVSAIEEYHQGKRKGYISPTAEEALREKTAELREKIEARDKKG